MWIDNPQGSRKKKILLQAWQVFLEKKNKYSSKSNLIINKENLIKKRERKKNVPALQERSKTGVIIVMVLSVMAVVIGRGWQRIPVIEIALVAFVLRRRIRHVPRRRLRRRWRVTRWRVTLLWGIRRGIACVAYWNWENKDKLKSRRIWKKRIWFYYYIPGGG